jgi:molybdopterin-guanine dinucleotide biosynthesis protein A
MSPKIAHPMTGVILAGGKSSRMGSNKALLQIEGKTFIEHIAETLRLVVSRVIIIADRQEEFAFLALPMYPDIYKECGPLAGLHSSFIHTDTPAVLAVTCDMPLLEASLLSSLLDVPPSYDAALFSSNEFIQPFPGFYRRSCLPRLEDNLQGKKYSVIGLIRALNVITFPVPPLSCSQKLNPFTQINEQSDYHRLHEEHP